jgi:hypothetical protein
MNTLPDGKDRHPVDEKLMEAALGSASDEVRRHCETCPSCAAAVKEFGEVRRRVESLDEKEIPESTARRILNITRHGNGRGGGVMSGIQALISNPFLIALTVAMVVLFLYFLLASEIFK